MNNQNHVLNCNRRQIYKASSQTGDYPAQSLSPHCIRVATISTQAARKALSDLHQSSGPVFGENESEKQTMENGISEKDELSAFGKARSTIKGEPLSADDIKKYNDFFKASLYLAIGMIYLQKNPLLQEPLSLDHIKKRQLGHFGSVPAQIFTYMHFNRMIRKYDLDAIFISGPGHGAPAVISQAYLEGTYSEVYPEKSEDPAGMQKLFHKFSFPGGTASHASPEVPGSIHEGGELGYSLSHAFGAVFDHPDLIALTIVGDGEAETGPLATSWHSNKFLNPITDGAVLPVLNANQFKIANPTILSRIPQQELESLFIGLGWTPYFVSGDDIESMHQAMAATLEHCVKEIKGFQKQARDSGKAFRPRWPVVILRTPKGWTAPRKVDGHFLEGYWRAHQVPITTAREKPEDLKILEDWMRSYEPERLFGKEGKISPELRALCPVGNRRMSANPIANGGLLRKPLKMPNFKDYALPVEQGGAVHAGGMVNFAKFLRDIMKNNPTNFRLMGPDETASNKLDTVYEVTQKVWLGEYAEEDADGGHLSLAGRVMEMLSEHQCEGWLEGYLLTGGHGMLSSYEAFLHIIDSMVNQHAKWLEKTRETEWRVRIASLNVLAASPCWRQDHNGFSHASPGFLEVVANKSPEVVRIYLPPDGNCLLSVMDHCFRSTNYVNVIVADKKENLQYLNMDEAVIHCTKGIGIWPRYSTDKGEEPDVVMASCGDIPTLESLAAIDLLLNHFPDLKIRCVNVVDLFKLISNDDHPHGLTDAEFDSLFTADKPVIFNFHAYPWMIHKLTYKRNGSRNIHVKGYREKGNIDTPLKLAIRNKADRFSLAISAIDHIPHLGNKGASAREYLKDQRISAQNHAFETGEDPHSVTEWAWPHKGSLEQAVGRLSLKNPA
ncbi:phosphoketolase [Microdochium trichocladiopsis]|uniref:Phosphoketolase n=1 Tax=Microdochium trichocladiopsis TaxID=1682393 RepID=A0A9P8Y421_9PEZI|nr:phosphoketolase [Microdochium trichocladiopsis]KAH7029192.1 phosphoketolase [Microdochium trichocladiopsis]